MRPETQSRWHVDPDFLRMTIGRRTYVLAKEFAPQAAEIAVRLATLESHDAVGAGNRASGYALTLDGGIELFARRARRGGAAQLVSREVFFGINPRPFRELKLTVAARKRGIAVAEPVGAAVQWVGPALYRGFFITRALHGMTLWEFIRTDDDPTVRAHVLGLARSAIETMHARGLWHADLNLENLMVTKAGDSFAIVILDLDKARLLHGAVVPAMRRQNYARLLRSARKLDPSGRYLDAAALAALGIA
jgi:Lipopolysaccharide kinase (Kdo/WaaP) family